MAQGADYSGGRPTGAQLKAAGFTVALRYIGLGSTGKRLNAAEYRDLTAAGVTVQLVAELGTGDSWGTSSDDDYGRGRANAAVALADARGCGVPEDKIFIFAASDAHAAAQWQITDTVAYVRGFRDILGLSRTGHYGFSETNIAVHNAGVCSGFWRCGSQPSTADKTWVNFWQRNAAPTTKVVAGVVCDINDVYHPITQGDDVNLGDPITAYHANGTAYTTTVGEVLAKLPAVLECVRPGNGWSVTDGWLSGALSNTNTRLPAIQDGLTQLGANLSAFETADAERDTQLLAAVGAVQAGDVHALADALIPLLPKSATPDDVTAAIRAAFTRAAGA